MENQQKVPGPPSAQRKDHNRSALDGAVLDFIQYQSLTPVICQLNGWPHFFVVLFLIPFFLKLIVACRLCVIYVKEDNDSNV